MLSYEDGTNEAYKEVRGFGAGENEGSAAVRIELLWRDFMRLSSRKFKGKLFRLEGSRIYKENENVSKWKSPDKNAAEANQDPSPDEIARILERFFAGTTGLGLIDASQREVLHTGYTSNRARQNVASFLAKHLDIDWRYGAEWYEMLLLDYDVSSNWANWQYVAGVGLDPRGDARKFNPVKQAFDYDKDGAYVRGWVPEVSKLEKLENVFQACTADEEELERAGLKGNPMATDPVRRIEFFLEGKPKAVRRPFVRRRGTDRRPDPAGEAASPVVVVGQPSSQPPSNNPQLQGLNPPSGPRHQRQGSHSMGHQGDYRGRGVYRGRGGYRGRYSVPRGQPHGQPPQGPGGAGGVNPGV